ncbi:MAG: DUF1573 domain-containing protein [Phycisphaerales bacterium]
MIRNYLVLTLIFSVLLLVQSGCHEQATVAEKSTAALTESPDKLEAKTTAPKITFEKLECRFGEIGAGVKKKTAEFKFTNTGDDILKIIEVQRCCGVTAKVDKEELSPGESGIVTAELSLSHKAGIMLRTIYVKSNDEINPRVALTIRAEIKPKVACSPKKLKLYLEEENAGCPKIVLSSLDEKPFSITKFKSTADSISAEIDSSVEATKFVLEPKVDMEKLGDNLKGHIDIGLTHPEEDIVEVLFDVLPKYTLYPPLIIAFNAKPGKAIVRNVSVLNNYGGDFEIESATSSDGMIKVLKKKKISNGYQLDIEIMPPQPAKGETRFVDVLVVKIEGGYEMKIICRGFYANKKT